MFGIQMVQICLINEWFRFQNPDFGTLNISDFGYSDASMKKPGKIICKPDIPT